MSSAVRNRSEDRAPARDSSATREHHRENQSRTQPSSLRENGGSNFLSGLRSSSTRAADIFSKGFFGKSGRSGGASERESGIDDEHYQLKVINLPLVEQARLTRISTRLEDSRDKTEFWMPAFPWRAIDYLNYKGCEVEGLYRVPGSGPQIKKWQRKFDERELRPCWIVTFELTKNRIRCQPIRRARTLRYQHHRLHAQGVAEGVTRRAVPQSGTRPHSARMRRRRGGPRPARRRALEPLPLQLLSSIRHNLPPQSSPCTLGQEQDGF